MTSTRNPVLIQIRMAASHASYGASSIQTFTINIQVAYGILDSGAQKGDEDALQTAQRRSTGLISGLKGLLYDERLKGRDLSNPSSQHLSGDLIGVFKIFNGINKAEARVLLQSCFFFFFKWNSRAYTGGLLKK